MEDFHTVRFLRSWLKLCYASYSTRTATDLLITQRSVKNNTPNAFQTLRLSHAEYCQWVWGSTFPNVPFPRTEVKNPKHLRTFNRKDKEAKVKVIQRITGKLHSQYQDVRTSESDKGLTEEGQKNLQQGFSSEIYIPVEIEPNSLNSTLLPVATMYVLFWICGQNNIDSKQITEP